jgi:hypothetical protein
MFPSTEILIIPPWWIPTTLYYRLLFPTELFICLSFTFLNWTAYYLVERVIGSDHCILVIDIHPRVNLKFSWTIIYLSFFCVFDTISLHCSDWHYIINILLIEVSCSCLSMIHQDSSHFGCTPNFVGLTLLCL